MGQHSAIIHPYILKVGGHVACTGRKPNLSPALHATDMILGRFSLDASGVEYVTPPGLNSLENSTFNINASVCVRALGLIHRKQSGS